jgi:hypothetical protein
LVLETGEKDQVGAFFQPGNHISQHIFDIVHELHNIETVYDVAAPIRIETSDILHVDFAQLAAF